MSNLTIRELFYSHILNMNRGSLNTRSFRRTSCIHFSVFRYRWTKNDITGPEKFPRLWRNGPLVLWAGICLIEAFNASIASWEKIDCVDVMTSQLASFIFHFRKELILHADMSRGTISRKPWKLFGPGKPSKISNLTITELFYSHLWREVFFTQEVSGVYTSPFLDTDELEMA